jgi:hypothetical protein
MAHARTIEAIRRLVAGTFSALGIDPEHEYRESILICDGAYCGRRFETAEGHAIWFLEEDQLKFYRPDGSVLRVLEPATAYSIPERVAA